MQITLLNHTMSPEKLVAASAKLCYSQSDASSIYDNLDQGKAEKFVDMLSSLGHESPLEHVSFTFGIDGVSRSLTHQLVRHRMASYSQQSQRYVRVEDFRYVVPPAIEANEEAKAVYKEAMSNVENHYMKITEILFEEEFQKLVNEGKAREEATRMAEKKAIEDARYLFPNATETKIVVTMNARSLLNFFRHRCCNRAQWEIREMAEVMLRMVREVAPTIFKDAGPSCLVGPCPEGRMTCGEIVEVRNKFKA